MYILLLFFLFARLIHYKFYVLLNVYCVKYIVGYEILYFMYVFFLFVCCGYYRLKISFFIVPFVKIDIVVSTHKLQNKNREHYIHLIEYESDFIIKCIDLETEQICKNKSFVIIPSTRCLLDFF